MSMINCLHIVVLTMRERGGFCKKLTCSQSAANKRSNNKRLIRFLATIIIWEILMALRPVKIAQARVCHKSELSNKNIRQRRIQKLRLSRMNLK